MQPMFLKTKDLLYAHACLCEYAGLGVQNGAEFDNKKDAERLAEVINNFQEYLKDELKPNARSVKATEQHLRMRGEDITFWMVTDGQAS